MSGPLVLLLTPEEADAGRANGRVRLIARLSGSNEYICTSHQPLADGARVLLARGFAPATLMTARHVGKPHDSFKPAPIGQWAKLTYTEGESAPLRRQRWVAREMPIAAAAEGQKSTSEPSPVGRGHSTEDRSHGDAQP